MVRHTDALYALIATSGDLNFFVTVRHMDAIFLIMIKMQKMKKSVTDDFSPLVITFKCYFLLLNNNECMQTTWFEDNIQFDWSWPFTGMIHHHDTCEEMLTFTSSSSSFPTSGWWTCSVSWLAWHQWYHQWYLCKRQPW